MYKIVLVDDEAWALKGIQKVFKFKEIGFEVVLETTNPHVALQTLLSQNVDIVFSDIRMPEISGLELMQKVRQANIDTEFVFVSGHADFQYAQEALKLGAFDYCLKPISFEDAHSTLKRLISHLEAKRYDHDIETFESLYENRTDLEKVLQEQKLSFIHPYLLVLTVNTLDTAKREDLLYFPDHVPHLDLYLGSGRYIYILNLAAGCETYLQKTLLPALHELRAFCGLSGTSEDFGAVSRLLAESLISADSDFIYKDPRVTSYVSKHERVKALLEKLYGYLDAKNSQYIKDLLLHIPEYFVENELGMSEVLFLWNQIAAHVSYKYTGCSPFGDLFFSTHDTLRLKFKSIQELCDDLLSALDSIFSTKESQPGLPQGNESMKQILEYIKENYKNELYLKDIAGMFHLNFNYVSTLFKKITGMTFTEYISEIRLTKACELLLNTQMSIEEICMESGYNDYYHFNKTFKKRYGIPPAKYRKQN